MSSNTIYPQYFSKKNKLITTPVSCIYCKVVMSNKGIFTHVIKAHLGNGKFADISKRVAEKHAIAKIEYENNPKLCLCCNGAIAWVDRKCHREVLKFCGHSCSAAYSNKNRKEAGWSPSIEHRRNLAKLVSTKYGECFIAHDPIIKTCVICDVTFEIKPKNRKEATKKCCSKKCANLLLRKKRKSGDRDLERTQYKRDCSFRFNVYTFPDEFDLSLITEHGWYSPSNKKNNLYGISRDHMISRTFGFDNNLPPEHLAHPANCELLPHSQNASKGIKNTITYEALLLRIEKWNEKWNEKYGVY